MAPKTNKDVQAAAEKIVLDPSLTAKEALLQVGVSEDLASNKYWQKNVRRKRNTIERHRNVKLAKKQKASHTPNTGKSQPTLSHPSTSTSITINYIAPENSRDKAGYRRSPEQKTKSDRTYLTKKIKTEFAYEEAIKLYYNEKNKVYEKENYMSCKEVCDFVGECYGVNIAQSTVYKKVQNGEFKLKRTGPEGILPDDDYNVLKSAYLSFLTIEQSNPSKQEVTSQSLENKLKCALNHTQFSVIHFHERLKRDLSLFFASGKVQSNEQLRQQWLTDTNLNAWYNNWKLFLIEMGFAVNKPEFDKDENMISEITLLPGMSHRILNLDESDLSLDGNSNKVGGAESVAMFVPGCPRTGTGTPKSSDKNTVINSCSAAGDAGPPHIEFSSSCKLPEDCKVREEWITCLPSGRGKFGFKEERHDIPATIGSSEKGGMNSEKFYKYINENIIPLYEDAADVPGKRVIIKCDGGPGRLEYKTLVALKLRGFYLVTALPNSSTITQECDKLFGPMKTIIRENLDIIFYEILHEDPQSEPSLKREHIATVLNGRPASGNRRSMRSAFHEAFSKESIIKAWEKCGAIPLNRMAIQDPSVLHYESNSKNHTYLECEPSDPNYVFLLSNDIQNKCWDYVQRRNDECIQYLEKKGFNASHFKAILPETKAVTAEKLKENSELPASTQIHKLLGASTHGKQWVVTGSSVFTKDKLIFKAEVQRRENEYVLLKAKWKEDKAKYDRQVKAEKSMLKNRGKPYRQWTKTDLTPVAKWYYDGKKGITDFISKKSASQLADWIDSESKKGKMNRVNDPGEEPEYPKEIIELKDTEVGRMREKATRDLINISEGQYGTAFADNLRGLFEEAKKTSNGDSGVKFDMSQLHNHENSGDD